MRGLSRSWLWSCESEGEILGVVGRDGWLIMESLLNYLRLMAADFIEA